MEQPRGAEPERAPYFFLSYAHTPRYNPNEDPDTWVKKLYHDLCEHVVELTNWRHGMPGFIDHQLGPGNEWPYRLARSLATCRVFVPLYSYRYFESEHCGKEWFAFARRVRNHQANGAGPTEAIVPALWIPVEPTALPKVAQPLQFKNPRLGDRYCEHGFYGIIRLSRYRKEYEEAVYELAREIVTVAHRTAVPAVVPESYEMLENAFGSSRSHSRTPAVWNVASRNAVFTGRDGVLERLRDQLASGSRTVVLPQAIYGLGGIGKTQLALEYAHRFMADYDLVWWVSAEQTELLNPIMAQLAARLGIQVGENVADAARAAGEVLRRGDLYPRWLLIFDNADDPAEIQPYLPGGSGHVLITSRNQAWSSVADPLELEVFLRQESVTHLLRRVPGLDPDDAEKIAQTLGDLPLAIEQAAAWLNETAMPAPEYLGQLKNQLTRVLELNPPSDYPSPVAATWNLSFQQLREASPAAARLVQLCAFFAPEAISMALLYSDEMVDALLPYDPDVNAKIVLGRLVRDIGRFALLRIDQASNTIQIHRLVQAVIRDKMTAREQEDTRHEIHRILLGARPRQGGTDDPENWARYDEIWPHLAPSGTSTCDEPATLQLLIDRVRYLYTRGEFAAGLAIGTDLDRIWTERHGANDPRTLHLRFQLANILRAQGRYADARELDGSTLASQRELLTLRHPHTLMTAGSLGADLRALGEFEQALAQARETYDNFKDLFGEDHPSTLSAANNLAVSLRLVGDCFAARDLDRDTLARRRSVLGLEHPYTFSSAANLARDLREAGAFAESVDQLQVVLAGYRRVLGDDSPDTLDTAKSLAVSLRRAGAQQEARQLTEETHGRYLQRYNSTIPGALACALNLACDLSATDEKPRAVALAREVMAQYSARLGPDHPYTLAAANNLSTYLRASDAIDEAAALANRTHQALRRKVGEQHPFTLSCAVNLANCLADLGQLDRVEQLERETLARIRVVLGRFHPDALACEANLAVTVEATGPVSEADEAREQALVGLRATVGDNHPSTIALRAGERNDLDLEPQPI